MPKETHSVWFTTRAKSMPAYILVTSILLNWFTSIRKKHFSTLYTSTCEAKSIISSHLLKETHSTFLQLNLPEQGILTLTMRQIANSTQLIITHANQATNITQCTFWNSIHITCHNTTRHNLISKLPYT